MFNLAARLTLDSSQFSSGIRNATRQMNATRSATSRMSSSLHTVSSGLSELGNRSSGAMSEIKRLAGGIMTVVGAQKLLNATIGEAAKMEMEKVSLNALFKGNQKSASVFFNYLNDAAKNSFFEQKDFLSTGKAFVPIMKSVKDLEYVTKLTERLGASNPLEGMEGAAFSIREALSGDMTSLAERFNLPKSSLKGIKEATTMTGKLKALDKVLSGMGYTQNYINQVNGTAYARWLKLKDTISLAMQDIGKAALEKAKPTIDLITKALSGKEFEQFKNKAATAFAGLFANLTNGVQTIYKHRAEIANFATSIISAMQTVGSIVGKVAGFFITHWNGISSIILGVAAAMITFKIGMAGLMIIKTVTNMVTGLRTAYLLLTGAQIALNGAMAANVVGAIILAFSLLVGAAVIVWKNWDLIKKKTVELWNKLGIFKGYVLALLGPIGMLIGAGILLYKNWDKVKSGWSTIWSSIVSATTKSVNTVIDGINTLISQINKIPGVSIPLVAHVKWDRGVQAAPGRLSTRSVMDKITVNKKPTTTTPYNPKYFSNMINGSYAAGISKIPRDGWIAKLHKDEAVLTSHQADVYRKYGLGDRQPATSSEPRTGQVNHTVTIAKIADSIVIREEADIDKLLDKMVYKIQMAGAAGA